MKSKASRSFWRAYERLLPNGSAERAMRWSCSAQTTDILGCKKGGDNPALYSARVSRNYRTLGVVEGDTVIRFWIGDHEGYDRRVAGWRFA